MICYKFSRKHPCHNWLFNSLTSGVGSCYQTETAINGSVVLVADESPWPCGTPSWYTPLSWTILSEQKNLHLFLSQHICVFSKTSVRPSIRHTFLAMFLSSYHPEIFRRYYHWETWCPCKRSEVKGQGHRGHDPIQRLRNFSRSHQPKWPLLKLITSAIFTSHQSNLADVVFKNIGHFSLI